MEIHILRILPVKNIHADVGNEIPGNFNPAKLMESCEPATKIHPLADTHLAMIRKIKHTANIDSSGNKMHDTQ